MHDALATLALRGPSARLLAGGTTIYDMMKLRVESPAHLVDITFIDGLDHTDTTGPELHFGALATMASVAADPVVARDYPILAESLWRAASQQLRNMATVGGNLLQRTRCIYFRLGADGTSAASSYPCNKRNPGTGCAALEGSDRGQALFGTSGSCTAVSPGDWPVALVAMDALVEIHGPSGIRTIPVAELYLEPGSTPEREFSVNGDEIITAIRIPKTSAGRASTYHKIRDRESYAFALASAAVALQFDGDVVTEARIAMGGMATIPWRCPDAEAVLVGHPFTPTRAGDAAGVALEGAIVGRENGFRVELARRTIADALAIAFSRSKA